MSLRIYAFHCGGDHSCRALYDPLDENCGEVIYGPYFFYLIAHPSGNVLFDVGLNPKWRTGASTSASGTSVIEMEEGDDAVSKLKVLGLAPADISHVVLSHLHYDHAGGLQYFPEAAVVVQRRELQFAFWPPVYQRSAYDRDDFDRPFNWLEIDGDYDLFGDGTILVTPTPGHTPGHQAAVVKLASGMHVLGGDATYLTEKMRQRRLPGLLWSPDETVASWEKLEDLERRFGAKLMFSHDLDYKAQPEPPDHWYE